MSAAAPWGLMAEFASAGALLDAACRARAAEHARLDAYSPFPVEGLSEALGLAHDRVPLLVLLGGLCGGIGTFALEYYSAVIDYPINVGGRPLDSWPAFVPAALEMAILFAALFGVVGMLALNGLPKLYHPVFNVTRFAAASRDGFFLVVTPEDTRFDIEGVRRLLDESAPLSIVEVPA